MLTSHVIAKTRRKILSGKYFDISKLLPTVSDSENEDKKENVKMKKTFIFGDWVRCFLAMMNIRLEFAPNE